MAVFNIKQLFLNKNKVHIKIENLVGSVTQIDIFPNVHFYAKLTVPAGAESPVIYKLAMENELEVQDLFVYGSWTLQKPT